MFICDVAWPSCAVHLQRDLAELLVHGLLALHHGLGQLAAEGLDLLLEKGGRRIDGLLLRLDDEPEQNENDGGEEYDNCYIHSIVLLTVGSSSKLQITSTKSQINSNRQAPKKPNN